MFDYVFYSDSSCSRFGRWLEAHDVEYLQATGAQEEKLVRIPEDINDELLEEIDALYDELLAADESLLAEQDGQGYMHVAGISFSLADGRTVQIPVEPAFLNRLLGEISMEELGEFVRQIVEAVENPDTRPFCQQSRDHEP
jgi:hypothetical protein